jgi:alkylhydroperoxidase/carboxymuconolactone decarboxylase family protein YurZ
MTESVEQKQQRLEKLKAQQTALLNKAKEIQKRIGRVQSAEKSKRKKQDDHTKILLGVALAAAVKKNPQALTLLKEAVKGLPAKDQGFLAQESEYWAELNGGANPAVQSEAAKTPKLHGGVK